MKIYLLYILICIANICSPKNKYRYIINVVHLEIFQISTVDFFLRSGGEVQEIWMGNDVTLKIHLFKCNTGGKQQKPKLLVQNA